MTMTKQRVGDEMVVRTETVEPAIVDWDDIKGRAEPDDCYSGAPWEECDGYEHEFNKIGYYTHDGWEDSRGRVNRSPRDGGSGYITIDDDDVIKWGCTGYPGCSKQVRAETIARAKAKTLDLLVKWYCEGWYESCAIAEYGDYSDSVGGIWDEPWGDYTEELVLECRHNVADQLEKDGYTVENRPAVTNQYDRIKAFKERIKRNLDCSQ